MARGPRAGRSAASLSKSAHVGGGAGQQLGVVEDRMNGSRANSEPSAASLARFVAAAAAAATSVSSSE